MHTIDAAALTAALSPRRAVEVLEAAFRSLDDFVWPPRTVVDLDDADLLLMPASGPEGAGVKIVSVNPGNPARGAPLIHALYVLLSAESLAPEAIIDGEALTSLRTASLSALATKHLASEEARHMVVFGAGTQARAHIEAIPEIRPIEKVTIVSRTLERAERLAKATSRGGLEVSVGAPDAVAAADIVCTCTTSATPVFEGAALPPGAHVNAVGAYRPDARETDDALVRRADVVVETVAAATAEAGDVMIPLREGVMEESDLTELAEVLSGEWVRRPGADVTFFKSVGLAVEDLAVAAAVARGPRGRGA